MCACWLGYPCPSECTYMWLVAAFSIWLLISVFFLIEPSELADVDMAAVSFI